MDGAKSPCRPETGGSGQSGDGTPCRIPASVHGG
jgi:hypothetical protein